MPGHPKLREMLKEKLRATNELAASEVNQSMRSLSSFKSHAHSLLLAQVMITTGANQAFTNVVVGLMDAGRFHTVLA